MIHPSSERTPQAYGTGIFIHGKIIAAFDPIKVGTMSAIFMDVSKHLKTSKDALMEIRMLNIMDWRVVTSGTTGTTISSMVASLMRP